MSEHDQPLLDLFDTLWSQTPLFGVKPSSLPNPTTTHFAKIDEVPEKSKLYDFPAILHVRSMSETDITTALPISPNSVLSSTQKLETALKGREAGDFFGAEDSCIAYLRQDIEGSSRKKRETGKTTRRSRKKKKKKGIVRTSSRSLSELEFEEVKGFMDLGFVFSERDRDSALVSIIPGLQRLGVEGKGRGSDGDGVGSVSRPYLSEAWGVSEEQRKANPAMKRWRIPETGNDETAMKDHLKFWAHEVASTVR